MCEGNVIKFKRFLCHFDEGYSSESELAEQITKRESLVRFLILRNDKTITFCILNLMILYVRDKSKLPK
jgi:hypothetical protein